MNKQLLKTSGAAVLFPRKKNSEKPCGGRHPPAPSSSLVCPRVNCFWSVIVLICLFVCLFVFVCLKSTIISTIQNSSALQDDSIWRMLIFPAKIPIDLPFLMLTVLNERFKQSKHKMTPF